MTEEYEIIKDLGSWLHCLSLNDLEKAAHIRDQLTENLPFLHLDQQTRSYYNLLYSKHQMMLSKNEKQNDPSIEPFQEQLSSEKDSEQTLRYLYHYMEGTLLNHTKNYYKALKHYTAAEKQLGVLCDLDQANFYLRQANTFNQLGESITALNYAIKAYDTYKKSHTSTKKTVRSLLLIGNIYSKTGYYEKAKATFEDALTVKGLKDRQRADLYRSIAKNDYLFHYNQNAEHGFNMALNVDEELRIEFQADTLYRLANSCLRQGKQKEGNQLLHKIEEVLTKDHKRFQEFHAKSMISRGVFLHKPFHDEMILEGFRRLKDLEIQIELIELAHEVSDYYYANDNYEKAYDYLSFAKRQKKNIVE
ncbi:hypothetical protein DH09_20430 [Bacillaceae bacterium JMAK1]|nr:hypothetical protein DH09_20430 [Bacillaceae bacterium JMAK1]